MGTNGVEIAATKLSSREDPAEGDGGVHITCFTEVSDDSTLHFQIIRLHKQVSEDRLSFSFLLPKLCLFNTMFWSCFFS